MLMWIYSVGRDEGLGSPIVERRLAFCAMLAFCATLALCAMLAFYATLAFCAIHGTVKLQSSFNPQIVSLSFIKKTVESSVSVPGGRTTVPSSHCTIAPLTHFPPTSEKPPALRPMGGKCLRELCWRCGIQHSKWRPVSGP